MRPMSRNDSTHKKRCKRRSLETKKKQEVVVEPKEEEEEEENARQRDRFRRRSVAAPAEIQDHISTRSVVL